MSFQRTVLSAALVLSTVAWGAACVDSDPASGFGADETGDGDGDSGSATAEAKLNDCGVPPMEGQVVLGYVPNWVGNFRGLVDSLDMDTLTHVAIAFTNPTPDNSDIHAGPVADADLRYLIDAVHDKDVKVLMSIGGAAETEFIYPLLLEDARDEYIEDIMAYMDEFDIDGVDVDIEGRIVDEAYGPFVKALADRVRPEGKLVTSAVAQFFEDEVTDEALFCYDFINTMIYDYAGTWSEPGEHASRATARSRANYWSTNRGYPNERIVIGLPFYGYCWGSDCSKLYNPDSDSDWEGQVSFRLIEQAYPDDVEDDWIRDDEFDRTINFNSPDTILDKTEFARDYGGVMVWEMSQDGSTDQLMNAIKMGL